MLKVAPPSTNVSDGRSELDRLRSGTILIAVLAPISNLDLVNRLARGNITSFSLDAIPRISRAQSMDVLSSMSMI
ncbi:MAG: NAD(P)(+) transhydrogenase (Re/Si-specific) subunit alpha, partial [Proteobacteria bacterium]|nr:NAD(P)(+) transhydrogenase (Re/Si-specific) subunit alpha [Pseudomonadota bacterium]